MRAWQSLQFPPCCHACYAEQLAYLLLAPQGEVVCRAHSSQVERFLVLPSYSPYVTNGKKFERLCPALVAVDGAAAFVAQVLFCKLACHLCKRLCIGYSYAYRYSGAAAYGLYQVAAIVGRFGDSFKAYEGLVD